MNMLKIMKQHWTALKGETPHSRLENFSTAFSVLNRVNPNTSPKPQMTNWCPRYAVLPHINNGAPHSRAEGAFISTSDD